MRIYNRLGVIITVVIVGMVSITRLPSAHAATCPSTALRWSSTSNTIYLTSGAICTLTDVKAALPKAPLSLVSSTDKVWYLQANLKLEQGAKLVLRGSLSGGDVNELRLKSLNSGSSTSIIWIRAQWGIIDVSDTKITSWNGSGPDTEHSTYKRAFIHIRSFLESDGVTARESRFDIHNSDIGYLGYYGAEAYGLAWKVSGSSLGLYDKVNVYGNITDSHIHHNYFGVYTYGAYGMQILNNEFNNNIQYGLDPHDDSDNLVIENNRSHNNGNHGIICSQRCDRLTIRNNRSYSNTGHGIMIHRNVTDSLVEGNQTYNNSDTGLVVFDSHRNTLRNNKSFQNKNGLRLSVGSADNFVQGNELYSNTAYGLYFFKGSDVPTSGDGRPKKNTFVSNDIHNNQSYAVYVKESDQNIFENNILTDNARGVNLQNARGNIFRRNAVSNPTVQYLNAGADSDSIIENTDLWAVRIDDDLSHVDVVDTESTLLTNSKNLPLTASPSRTSIHQTRAQTESVVKYTRLKGALKPSGGTVTVKDITWQTSAPYTRQWKETASTDSLSVVHVIGDLAPNTLYGVKVNGEQWNSYTADATGAITFIYEGAYSGTKVFEVIAL